MLNKPKFLVNNQTPLELQSTYFLIAHGSRDPRPQVALENLGQLLYKRLTSLASPTNSSPARLTDASPLVGTGILELGPTSLEEQIQQFGEFTLSAGLTQVQLLPLFLLPGVHVMEDIPAAVMTAQQVLAEKIQLHLRPHLGTHQGLVSLLVNQIDKESVKGAVKAWILLAHGSRRKGGNAPIEAIAQALTSQLASHLNHPNVVTAYWSVLPSLEMQVIELVLAGHRQIGILPYFLFPGSTTDAITEEVERLGRRFSQVELSLADPLNSDAELVNLILDLTQLP